MRTPCGPHGDPIRAPWGPMGHQWGLMGSEWGLHADPMGPVGPEPAADKVAASRGAQWGISGA